MLQDLTPLPPAATTTYPSFPAETDNTQATRYSGHSPSLSRQWPPLSTHHNLSTTSADLLSKIGAEFLSPFEEFFAESI